MGFRIAAVFLMLVAIAGCAAPESSAPPVEVNVNRLSVGNLIHVKWKTRDRFNALVFSRGGSFRSLNWTANLKGQKIERRAGHDVITSDAPTREFEAVIPEQFADVGGDYPVMMPFSDGGVVLFTGHLDAVPIECQGTCSDNEVNSGAHWPPISNFVIEPASGQQVVVDGNGSHSAVNLKPGREGVFVYFGSSDPVRRAGYSVIADPGLPSWVLFELDRTFPQLVAHDSQGLGRQLEGSPTIFIPYRGGMRQQGLTHSGAVVGNQMLLALFGPTWAESNDNSRERFLTLLAHETFHFWNSTLFHSVDRPGGRWLHEGAAEAFAYLSLVEIGAITNQQFIDLQTEALNRCLVGLSGTDLPSSSGPWSARNHYNCGAIMEEVARRSLYRSGHSLWDLWSQIFGRAANNDGFYTHDDFFEFLIRLAGPDVAGKIRGMASGAVNGRESALEPFFLSIFSDVGTVLGASDRKWPDWYHRLVAERAISSAVESDCGPNGYFISEESSVRLIGESSCRNLKDETKVSKIGGHPVWSEGVSVYDYILESCRYRNTFPLSGPREDNGLQLVCPRLPARPTFLRYQSSVGDPTVGMSAD